MSLHSYADMGLIISFLYSPYTLRDIYSYGYHILTTAGALEETPGKTGG